ncbi:hypothetical protein FOC1_g10009470 [Fusarium oxysporum f. sp. cubense race 1]|uniref:Uncharacterized protein n=1 Tax=Fusarium oxysporum f. sp. cubense (strain race 1) TaxID=1229664 RepID=N4UIX4_FUSC1|nr:hypothetical protein FOC1_g10009470 [Fusarium oxysporum f. sp. cubense race 1]
MTLLTIRKGLVESSEEDEPFQLGGPTSSDSASSAVEESPAKKIEDRPGLEPAKLYRWGDDEASSDEDLSDDSDESSVINGAVLGVIETT